MTVSKTIPSSTVTTVIDFCRAAGCGQRRRSRHVCPRSTIAPKAEQVCDCAPGALASSRPSASSPVPASLNVPASSACSNTSASLASLHVPASLARPGVPALSARPHAPASSRHVGAGSNISREAEQGCAARPRAATSRNVKPGKVGKMRNGDVNGSFPTTYAEDRDGNSRASSFYFFHWRTRS